MRYVVSRLTQSVIVLVGVSVLVFLLSRLSGDPVALMLPPEASSEQIASLRQQLGFDQPLAVQFIRFLGGLWRGDFGMSIRHGRPAMELVLAVFPATLNLAALSFGLSLVVACPLGVISALRRNSLVDMFARVLSLSGQCFPSFWLGLVLILVFSLKLRWLPPSGYGDITYLILPAVASGLYFTALAARLLRSAMLEVMGEDYVRTARAKGLAERIVVYKHALRNASLPVVTVLGINLGYLLGGSVVIEHVFAYPGMGRLAYLAILNRDFPVIQAFVFFVAVLVIAISFWVDVIYCLLDPRIRYG